MKLWKALVKSPDDRLDERLDDRPDAFADMFFCGG